MRKGAKEFAKPAIEPSTPQPSVHILSIEIPGSESDFNPSLRKSKNEEEIEFIKIFYRTEMKGKIDDFLTFDLEDLATRIGKEVSKELKRIQDRLRIVHNRNSGISESKEKLDSGIFCPKCGSQMIFRSQSTYIDCPKCGFGMP